MAPSSDLATYPTATTDSDAGGAPLRDAVLVTGGAGFIGSHVAEALLNRGIPVVVVDEINDYYDVRQKQSNLESLADTASRTGTPFRFYRGSCEDAAFTASVFAVERIGRVCHLAARAGVRPSIKNPHLYIQANVTATLTLLDLARDHNVQHFVYASSSSVYGRNTKIPFAESDRTDHPVSPYAATKKTCELLASTYSHLYGLPTTGLRFFTVYGPRGRPDMAPFMFVDRIARGIPINQFGDGSSRRDYTFITDIVSGVIAALDLPVSRSVSMSNDATIAATLSLSSTSPQQHEQPTPALARIYNLGNSATVTLTDFIKVIEKTVGRKAIINVLPDQPGDVPQTYADLTLSSRDLSYCPQTSIDEGMRVFVDWYNESMHSTVPCALADMVSCNDRSVAVTSTTTKKSAMSSRAHSRRRSITFTSRHDSPPDLMSAATSDEFSMSDYSS